MLLPQGTVISTPFPPLPYYMPRWDASWALSYTPPVPWCPCHVIPYATLFTSAICPRFLPSLYPSSMTPSPGDCTAYCHPTPACPNHTPYSCSTLDCIIATTTNMAHTRLHRQHGHLIPCLHVGLGVHQHLHRIWIASSRCNE